MHHVPPTRLAAHSADLRVRSRTIDATTTMLIGNHESVASDELVGRRRLRGRPQKTLQPYLLAWCTECMLCATLPRGVFYATPTCHVCNGRIDVSEFCGLTLELETSIKKGRLAFGRERRYLCSTIHAWKGVHRGDWRQ